MQGCSLSGHARHLGGDCWELVANMRRQPSEKRARRQTKRVEAKGVRRAQASLATWLSTLEQHGCTDPKRITLGEVLRRYMQDAEIRPKTRSRYQALIDQHIVAALGPLPVAELKHTDLSHFYSDKQESGRLDKKGGLSAQTALHMHALIRAALNWAESEDLIDANPARKVKSPPKVQRERRAVWTEVQIADAIRQAYRSQVRVPAALAGWAGLRRSEICALRWLDVDLDGAALAVRQSVEQVGRELFFGEPKSRKGRRIVPMPRQLIELLRAHKAVQDEMRMAIGKQWNARSLVCCRQRDGEPIMPETLSSAWRNFVRDHGLEPRLELHGLRRSYTSNRHDQGAPDAVVQDWVGHADMRTTREHYIVSFNETELAVLRTQEERIAAAQARLDSARVCQSGASAVVSLAAAREKRRR